nr:hypothetical protein [Oceanococcus sp. HetDA_MAG_MS8]
MSWYRLARATVLLQLGRKYRRRLLRMMFALGLALTTSWAYPDVAALLAAQAPQWAVAALVVKTAVIFGGFVAVFWELSQILAGRDGQPLAKPKPEESDAPAKNARLHSAATLGNKGETQAPRPLDALAKKPRLRSRREKILQRD